MKTQKIFFLFIALISYLFYSCSTEKNTAVTRAYHNLTAHFNVYFNAKENFLYGVQKVEKQVKDDYNAILPVFKYDYEETPNVVNSEMQTVLEKAGKTILKHSITVKPKIKDRRNLTPKDIEFLKKKEYCKWIDDAYLLIGKANFYKHEYQKALITFRTILSKYKTENTRFEAQLWLAKTYIAQKKYQDAENTLKDLYDDPRHPKNLNKEILLTFADLYLKKKDYKTAEKYLKQAIDLVRKRDLKARLYYILAQISQLQGNLKLADGYYKKVIKLNPNYEMTFNAKIARATAFSGENYDEIKKQLKKLLRDEKNEEYQDQIYYALAIINLKERDTSEAIKNFKLSAQKSISNNSQKALAFLNLADIFFKRKNYLLAGKYYDSTMQYLDKNYPNYYQISKRAENTGLLVKYLGEIALQDSLQRVAKMPEDERNKLIQKLIEKAKQEEERKRAENQQNNYYDPLDFVNPQNTNTTSQGGRWYMYNPVLVSRGQNEFKKKWGNRKLEDNWRRKNKAIVSDDFDMGEEKEEENKNTISDKTKPEYYLQNLPLNDSLMEISNNKIKEALFNAALVYEERFNDYKRAIKLYEELLDRFPDNKYKLEVYYRLYRLYAEIGQTYKSGVYKSKIINEFPNSLYAKILKDPTFISKLNKLLAFYENLYDSTLKRYRNEDYNFVIAVSDTVIKNHPELPLVPYFLYLKAMSYGYLGNVDSLQKLLTLLVENYKDYEITQYAQGTLDAIKSGKYDYSIYKYTPDEEHAFITFVDKKTNLTILKFHIYKYAQSFSDDVKYNVDFSKFDGKYFVVFVKWFKNKDRALEFYKNIEETNIFKLAKNTEHHDFVISKTNYDILFKKDKNLLKYQLFYNKYYK